MMYKRSKTNPICWYEINGSKCQCPKCFGCRRKKPMLQHEAELMATKMNSRPSRRIARVKAYDCPWCDSHHVGHDNKLVPQWKQRKIQYVGKV